MLDTNIQRAYRVVMPDIVLLTTSEVAERFRVDTSAVRRWVAKGQLVPTLTTPGGRYRFDEASLDAFAGRASA